MLFSLKILNYVSILDPMSRAADHPNKKTDLVFQFNIFRRENEFPIGYRIKH